MNFEQFPPTCHISKSWSRGSLKWFGSCTCCMGGGGGTPNWSLAGHQVHTDTSWLRTAG